jgi:hypothetical protein
MTTDLDQLNIASLLVEKLREGFGDLKAVPSKMPAMDRMGETTWYDPGDAARAPFQSMRVQVIRDVEIRNFYDRSQLDMSNSFIITVMPDPSVPLPLYAADVDVHKGKYVHIITDLIPLSQDMAYRRKYETPVGKLREQYRDLPGLINHITDDVHKIYPALREFETFNSAGRIFGNVPVDQGALIISLLTDYAGLFSSFVKESRTCEVLKRDDVRKEAEDTLRRFMMMMSRFDFSEDMPKQPKRTA